MKGKIQAFKKKESPSQFGGTWTQVFVKFEGVANPEYGYELRGFSKNIIKDIKEGMTLVGYIETKNYQKKDGTMGTSQLFKAITPEYLYDLILKINPHVESVDKAPTTAQQKDQWNEDLGSTANPDDVDSESPSW